MARCFNCKDRCRNVILSIEQHAGDIPDRDRKTKFKGKVCDRTYSYIPPIVPFTPSTLVLIRSTGQERAQVFPRDRLPLPRGYFEVGIKPCLSLLGSCEFVTSTSLVTLRAAHSLPKDSPYGKAYSEVCTPMTFVDADQHMSNFGEAGSPYLLPSRLRG